MKNVQWNKTLILGNVTAFIKVITSWYCGIKCGIPTDEKVYLDNIVTNMKFCKLRYPSCHNINVTSMQSSKDVLLKSLKFEFWHVFIFSCIWETDGKVFSKNIVVFWHVFLYGQLMYFLFHMTIMTDS